MIDQELLRQRRAAEQAEGDAKLLYRYRVAAVRAGAPVNCLPGDSVKVDGEEGRVLNVDEGAEGTQRVHVRLAAKKIVEVEPKNLRIVTPHRPAVLLGEAELTKRLGEDQGDPHGGRALESLREAARRKLKEEIPIAIELFPYVEEAPDSELRRALIKVFRSRPFGEVEGALRQRKSDPAEADLVALPPLAASAPDETEASEILDRLEAMKPDQARSVVVRAGRCLVGAGGPGFANAEVRERVAALSREHPDKELRVALFVHGGVPALQSVDLLKGALESGDTEVRGAAALELFRRGEAEAVWRFAGGEQDQEILARVLEASTSSPPLDVVEHLLELGRKDAKLEEQTILSLASTDGDDSREKILELLGPWLDKGRKTNAGAAYWCAGMLGLEGAADKLLRLLTKSDTFEPSMGLAIEALARLGHESAREALDSWGVQMLDAGTWGEELVDIVGLLVGHHVDSRELLGRFLVDEPHGPARLSRALEAARVVLERGNKDGARLARRFEPGKFPRFRGLAEAIG